MFVKYTGRKKELHMTRPEQEEDYLFKGDFPVEVTKRDGDYFCGEFSTIFEETAAPATDEPDKTETTIEAFVEEMFPGKTISELEKDEIEAKCLEVTKGKVNLKKNKSAENMIKDFMAAV